MKRTKVAVCRCLIIPDITCLKGKEKDTELLKALKYVDIIPICPLKEASFFRYHGQIEQKDGIYQDETGKDMDFLIRKGTILCQNKIIKEKPDLIIVRSFSSLCSKDYQIQNGTIIKKQGILLDVLQNCGIKIIDEKDLSSLVHFLNNI